MGEVRKSKARQLDGERFGRWTVKSRAADNSKGREARWHCVCDCGTEKIVSARTLVAGTSQSCGCLRKERSAESNRRRLTKHGMTAGGNSRTYRIWVNMITRCTNLKASNWAYYGGRGITVCERWREFCNFYEDIGVIAEGMSLDRIDPNGDYTPFNTRIIPLARQARNSRRNVKLTIGGRTKCLAAWAETPGAAKYGTIWDRLNRGWDARRAVYG